MNLSATEIAQKQRHLHLLTRVRNNQPLSRPELAELEELKKTMDENTKAQRDKGTKAQSRESRASIAGAEIIESQDAAALFVGKNSRTIRRWEKEGMLTAVKDGKKVYIKNQLTLFATHEGKKPTQTKMKKDEAEAGIKGTRNERERMELEILKEEWVRKDETERNNMQKIMTVKRALLGQGRKLAMQLAAMTDPRKIQTLLDRENKAIIEGFAR